MARYVVYSPTAVGTQPANYVSNVVEWDGKAAYSPGTGLLMAEDTAGVYSPGNIYGTPPSPTAQATTTGTTT